ncbi:MAG: hypothetical protein LBG77_05480 [Dysgonamonadaceae bacterium]|jgi:hypothetical protein|nr:hypothetical protein [Dysgonamonadaceae bacterium]
MHEDDLIKRVVDVEYIKDFTMKLEFNDGIWEGNLDEMCAMPGLQEAFEDIEKGRVTRIYTPNKK